MTEFKHTYRRIFEAGFSCGKVRYSRGLGEKVTNTILFILITIPHYHCLTMRSGRVSVAPKSVSVQALSVGVFMHAPQMISVRF